MNKLLKILYSGKSLLRTTSSLNWRGFLNDKREGTKKIFIINFYNSSNKMNLK